VQVNVIAGDAQKLQELDDEERHAWSGYRERLRDLTGAAYEEAEDDCWQELQRELQALRQQRRMLTEPHPASV
jgi:hypothetical protein